MNLKVGYMEIEEYDKALLRIHETILETSNLAKELSQRTSLQLIGLDAVEKVRIEAKQVDISAGVINIIQAKPEEPSFEETLRAAKPTITGET
jgi:hypothetical protein